MLKNKFGFDSVVPSQKVWRTRNGKVEALTKPFLRSYVFFRANLTRINWRLFYSINGVIGFVRQSGQPAPIGYHQVMALQKLGQSSLPVHEMEYTQLCLNDRVIVTAGPLKGATGHFLSADNQSGCFVVSLDMFRRSLVTGVEASQIRPL